jgi:hypothetical protein
MLKIDAFDAKMAYVRCERNMLIGTLVTTAWHFLGLRLEGCCRFQIRRVAMNKLNKQL